MAAGPVATPPAGAERTVRYSAEEHAEALRNAGRHLASVTARTMPSVVNIESTHMGKSGETDETGSGVIMKSPRTPGLFVITNRHVVEGAPLNKIDIHLNDGRVLTPTEKLEDADSDLAVLRIPDVGVIAAQFGDSDNLDIGHFVLAMGSPFGLTESVTLGIISAKGRRSLELPGRNVVNQDFLQTDAAINPGNSGGPLIDLDGRVIGINTAIASQGGGNEGIGFSIPSNLVQFVVSQLLDYGRVRRGYLGVQLDEHFNFESAKRYGLDRKQGARVTKVMDNTPAALAGIRPDDVILNFDGFDVADERDLINKVSITPVNKQVRVVVLRTGKRQPLTVILSEKPEKGMSQLEPVNKVLVKPAGFKQIHSGIEVEPLTPSLARQTGFSDAQQGLLVKQVSDSAIEQGLQLYDVIEEAARQPVTSLEEFEDVISAVGSEEPVVLKVTRVSNGRVASRLILLTPAARNIARQSQLPEASEAASY
ncbi:trypsin-like peptidase domain-containing protein [Planctomicrobium sp. SH661]|uniref:trypsin-like peptidase domain-containing protein n=1 Tax=Planctomicrobium sp. SH661 TaxID=3448124 RepID=UPI003F5BEBF9